MKSKLLLQLCSVTCLSLLLFSCSSSRYARYEKKSPGYALNAQLNDKKNPQNIFNGSGKIEEAIQVDADKMPVNIPAPVENAAPANVITDNAPAVVIVPNEVAPVISTNPIVATKGHKAVTADSWLVRKMIRSYNKSAAKHTAADGKKRLAGTDIIEIIFAIILPPVAVYLHEDDITNHFWIDLLLTILGWVPGMIYAFLIILDEIG